MLPGFRFLFAATLLSLSILVFGLGAAALLRAAHEEIASTPARQTPREPVFAQPAEAPQPTLALLRFDPPAAEKAPAELPAASEPSAPAPVATPPVATTPAEGEQTAALKPEEAAKPDEPAKPEVSAPQTTEAAPAPVEAATAPAEAPAPPADVKLAAIPDAPQPTIQAAPAPLAQMDAAASPATSEAATRIATLGGPAVTIDKQTAAKPADAKSTTDASSKHATAKKHRRAAQHARLARQATVAQQPADPFGQPQPTITRRAP
jgi:hypothetical protein